MFSASNTTRRRPPGLPFADITARLLGRTYDLSLVFVGDRRSETLHRRYQGKTGPANVLSFPLRPGAGEIAINLAAAAREAAEFNHNATQHVGYLFIHGLLHLKGLSHGSTMERQEQKFFNYFFNRHGTQHRHRTRYRHHLGAAGCRRTRKK